MDDPQLRPPRHRADPRVVGYWRLALLLLTGVPVVGAVVFAVLIPPAAPGLLALVGAVGGDAVAPWLASPTLTAAGSGSSTSPPPPGGPGRR